MSGSDTQLCKEGFGDWKHSERLDVHEVSRDHLECVVKLAAVQKDIGRIDSDLAMQAK